MGRTVLLLSMLLAVFIGMNMVQYYHAVDTTPISKYQINVLYDNGVEEHLECNELKREQKNVFCKLGKKINVIMLDKVSSLQQITR